MPSARRAHVRCINQSVCRSSFIVIVLALLGSSTARAQPSGRPQPDGGFYPATNQELLDTPALIAPGTNVDLQAVVVRAKSGNMMRVSLGRRQLFVAPIDPSMLGFIRVGAIVDVRGTLRASPGAAQARVTYAIDRKSAAQLARDRVFVDAWSVSPRS